MDTSRVLILASSSAFAAATVRDLHADPAITVAASVFTERDAVSAIGAGGVDMVLCDTRIIGLMPRMFLQRVQVLARPVPVVLLCRADDVNAEMYRKIAADVIRLPLQETSVAHQGFVRDLINRIKMVAAGGSNTLSSLRYKWRPGLPFATRFQGIVALGASAGGTEATEHIMRKLPGNLPGMVITQHMPAGFTKTYAERLNKVCQMKVREAADGDEIAPGNALVAPGGMQMRVMKIPGRMYPVVRCRGEERVSGHCPSVDALFESVATAMVSTAVGIILTGMGSDGAEGLLAMRRKGCFTIGQDENTSMVYGMPRVAFQKGAVVEQLPLEEIAQALCSHLMTRA